MNSKLLARAEKALVLMLAASFTLPVLLGYGLHYSPYKFPHTAWLRNRTLIGVQVKPDAVPFSRDGLLSARYQEACANNYALRFAGRELFIRVIDEIYLRCFHLAPVGVLIGPHLSLIEPAYLEEYCLARHGGNELRPFVRDLRRFQDFCASQETPFVLVITPSKAALYPENMPAGWLRRYRPGPRDYDHLLPLLREQGVQYVDGHRLTAELKARNSVPVFPIGGIHWGDPAALATTNMALDTLAGQGLPVRPIRNYTALTSNDPADQDEDMARLLNTVFPLHYPVTAVTVHPEAVPPDAKHPGMVLVGGSFTWKMLHMLGASGQFSELDFYFYYRQGKFCKIDDQLHKIAEPTPPLDFPTDVLAADAFLLEINEESIRNPQHLMVFLQDALAHLPAPGTPKPSFHYESRMDYRWGDVISFVEGKSNLKASATKGLTPPGDSGAFTVGPLSSICLAAPPATQDMVLEVDASAFLAGHRVPEQRVNIRANGHPVGEWVWREETVSRREAVIPKEYLDGGKVLLEFQISHHVSPAELGLGRDPRRFGIYLSSLQLHPARG